MGQPAPRPSSAMITGLHQKKHAKTTTSLMLPKARGPAGTVTDLCEEYSVALKRCWYLGEIATEKSNIASWSSAGTSLNSILIISYLLNSVSV